jgi:hypothetical protein
MTTMRGARVCIMPPRALCVAGGCTDMAPEGRARSLMLAFSDMFNFAVQSKISIAGAGVLPAGGPNRGSVQELVFPVMLW